MHTKTEYKYSILKLREILKTKSLAKLNSRYAL